MRRIKMAAVAILLILLSSCAIYHHYGPFYGKVVDGETQEPLQGVAVLAVYYTYLPTVAGSVSKYLDARETVTDKNGEFRIPANNTFTFRPLNFFRPDVSVTIFKPGYGYYPFQYPFFSLPSNEAAKVELPKLKKGEKYSGPSVDHRVPRKKMRKFVEIENEWREQIGVEPLPIN